MAETVKYCPNCGRPIRPEWKHCVYCSCDLQGVETGTAAEYKSDVMTCSDIGVKAEEMPKKQETAADPDYQVISVNPTNGEMWVCLKKTQQRVNYRIYTQIFSVIAAITVAVIFFSYKVPFDTSILGINAGAANLSFYEMMTTFNSPLMTAMGIITLIGIIITPISPRMNLIPASAIFVMIAMLIVSQFDVTVYHITTTYALSADLELMEIALLLCLPYVSLIPDAIAEIFMAKTLNKNGRINEMETTQRFHGFIYNVDPQWNYVWRKP